MMLYPGICLRSSLSSLRKPLVVEIGAQVSIQHRFKSSSSKPSSSTIDSSKRQKAKQRSKETLKSKQIQKDPLITASNRKEIAPQNTISNEAASSVLEPPAAVTESPSIQKKRYISISRLKQQFKAPNTSFISEQQFRLEQLFSCDQDALYLSTGGVPQRGTKIKFVDPEGTTVVVDFRPFIDHLVQNLIASEEVSGGALNTSDSGKPDARNKSVDIVRQLEKVFEKIPLVFQLEKKIGNVKGDITLHLLDVYSKIAHKFSKIIDLHYPNGSDTGRRNNDDRDEVLANVQIDRILQFCLMELSKSGMYAPTPTFDDRAKWFKLPSYRYYINCKLDEVMFKRNLRSLIYRSIDETIKFITNMGFNSTYSKERFFRSLQRKINKSIELLSRSISSNVDGYERDLIILSPENSTSNLTDSKFSNFLLTSSVSHSILQKSREEYSKNPSNIRKNGPFGRLIWLNKIKRSFFLRNNNTFMKYHHSGKNTINRHSPLYFTYHESHESII